MAEAQALVDQQVAALTAGRDCWTLTERPNVIPATVIVKGANVDKSVAWEVTLDEAFAANRSGDSWDDVIVIKACS